MEQSRFDKKYIKSSRSSLDPCHAMSYLTKSFLLLKIVFSSTNVTCSVANPKTGEISFDTTHTGAKQVFAFLYTARSKVTSRSDDFASSFESKICLCFNCTISH